MGKVNLLCLPHAGGTAALYYDLLANEVDENIKIVPVELPGRGNRFCEELLEDFNKLADMVMNEIKSIIMSDDDYALFGYSMGSRLIFEIYYRIANLGLKLPVNMFFCASETPKFTEFHKNLDDESIKKDLFEYGGTPGEVMENEELLEIIIPIMRADLKVLNSYKYVEYSEKIKCPIIIINGKRDYETIAHVEDWKNYSKSICEFVFYEGGHFFIHDYKHNVGRVISEKIKRDLKM